MSVWGVSVCLSVRPSQELKHGRWADFYNSRFVSAWGHVSCSVVEDSFSHVMSPNHYRLLQTQPISLSFLLGSQELVSLARN
jgi:hypothetical protein